MTDWPSNAPHPSSASYDLYRMDGDAIYPLLLDTPLTEDEVAARFEERHGKPPEYIVAWFRHCWLGPVPA